MGGLGGLREYLVMPIVSSVTSWRIIWVLRAITLRRGLLSAAGLGQGFIK